ncbi:MAG: helix-turn-helix transcriptional regulator [Chloroflexi bacterium]|nr:helix-turn-helix transcriptional regulator [Chloroflexota bacterium]
MSQIHTPNLTEREKQILALASQGLTNKGIAQSLNISPRTVEFHLKNIFSKLNVSSRITMILLAKQIGLLEN